MVAQLLDFTHRPVFETEFRKLDLSLYSGKMVERRLPNWCR